MRHPGVGGACFEVPAGATQAAIEAHDDFGPPPVLAVSFGVFGGYALCDGSGTVNVTGETQMGVFADNTASAVWGCLRPSVPLRGTITVTFS